METDYDIAATKVTTAGVFRCCVGTVGHEYEGKRVKLGDASACKHCREKFTLVNRPGKPYPIWLPDWQIEQDRGKESK